MNPNPSDIEILSEITKAREHQTAEREKEWAKVLPKLVLVLDETLFAKETEARAIYIQFIKDIWTLGYHAGSTNMAMEVARHMGMDEIISLFKIAEAQPNVVPRNN
jgi:hypothetical protein